MAAENLKLFDYIENLYTEVHRVADYETDSKF